MDVLLSYFAEFLLTYHPISTSPPLNVISYICFSSHMIFFCSSCWKQLCVASNCSFSAVTDESLSLSWLFISQIHSLLISARAPALPGPHVCLGVLCSSSPLKKCLFEYLTPISPSQDTFHSPHIQTVVSTDLSTSATRPHLLQGGVNY